MSNQAIRQRVRDAIMRLRRTPMPIDDLIPLLQTCESRIGELTAESEKQHALLVRLLHWDMLDSTADGKYWKSEIDKALD